MYIILSINILSIPYLPVCKLRFWDVKIDLNMDLDLRTSRNCNNFTKISKMPKFQTKVAGIAEQKI